MPPASFVYTLPTEVLEELKDRLINNGFSHYEELSDWLKSLGHNIGKSAIHRYGSQLELDIQNKIPESAYPLIDFRMRCIEASVKSGSSDVLGLAQSYFDWAIQN